MKTKLLAIPALLFVALVGLAGCGSSDSDAGAPPAEQTQTTATSPMDSTPQTTDRPTAAQTSDSEMGGMVMIDIKDFMYEGGMSVAAGEMVMVTNDDAEAHTLTSDEAGMFAVTVAPGKTAMFDAPMKAGSYAYHCDFHANMTGSLVVG